MFLLAHAGENHVTKSEGFQHLLSTWYLSLPLFLFTLAALTLATYYLSKKSVGTSFIVACLFLLISGFAFYEVSAVISVVSITLGMAGTMLSVFTSLSGETKQ